MSKDRQPVRKPRWSLFIAALPAMVFGAIAHYPAQALALLHIIGRGFVTFSMYPAFVKQLGKARWRVNER